MSGREEDLGIKRLDMFCLRAPASIAHQVEEDERGGEKTAGSCLHPVVVVDSECRRYSGMA